jgi:hypothetical protein
MLTYRHRKQTRLIVFQLKVLVCEFLRAPDSPRARAVSVQEVAALDHEAFNLSKSASNVPICIVSIGIYHTMKLAALVALRLPATILRLARAELAEILGCLGHDGFVQLHFDASEFLAWGFC